MTNQDINVNDNQNISSTEQPTAIPDEVEQNSNEVDKDEMDSFGKFKTAQELKTAYQNLEQEFTRKSQRLKELEKELATQKENDKWTEKVKELHAKYPCSQSMGEEITAYLKKNKGLMQKDNCLETALLHVLAERFESKKSLGNTPKSTTNLSNIVETPTQNVETPTKNVEVPTKNVETPTKNVEKRDNMPLAPDGGEMMVAPRIRVNTVKDAGKLATERLKKYKK